MNKSHRCFDEFRKTLSVLQRTLADCSPGSWRFGNKDKRQLNPTICKRKHYDRKCCQIVKLVTRGGLEAHALEWMKLQDEFLCAWEETGGDFNGFHKPHTI